MRPLLVLTSAMWDGVEVILSRLRDLDVRSFALTDDKVMVIPNEPDLGASRTGPGGPEVCAKVGLEPDGAARGDRRPARAAEEGRLRRAGLRFACMRSTVHHMGEGRPTGALREQAASVGIADRCVASRMGDAGQRRLLANFDLRGPLEATARAYREALAAS